MICKHCKKPISEEDRLQVDIYWPNSGGYGIPKRVYTLQQAAAEVDKLRRSGYGNPMTGPHISVIQVRRIRVDRFPLEMLTEDCTCDDGQHYAEPETEQ